jgi:hypothetical protein
MDAKELKAIADANNKPLIDYYKETVTKTICDNIRKAAQDGFYTYNFYYAEMPGTSYETAIKCVLPTIGIDYTISQNELDQTVVQFDWSQPS